MDMKKLLESINDLSEARPREVRSYKVGSENDPAVKQQNRLQNLRKNYSPDAKAAQADRELDGGFGFEPLSDAAYSKLMMIVDAAIGNAFPDGDPIDSLIRQLRPRLGDRFMDHLDRAVQQHTSSSSYNDYVRDVWQQHMDDNPDLYGRDNPWN